jgi:hypothetical protein
MAARFRQAGEIVQQGRFGLRVKAVVSSSSAAARRNKQLV